jgi:hypothetical protein
MKITTILIALTILPTFLLGQDTVEVKLDYKDPKGYLPFSIDVTTAREADWIKFEAPRLHGLTIIIPKADTLFADDLESIGFIIGRKSGRLGKDIPM